MRKQQKEELVEIIQTLGSAIEELKKLVQERNGEALLELLEDCQGVAIAVGTAIDEAEQTDTKAVRMLEQFCEMVYLCSGEGDEVEQLRICQQMEQQLIQIEKEIQDGIKTQKLVVFLPYKASMWDSLESVWKASCEDEEWQSIVMPIPYFNKKQDGTLGELQYEGDLFPKEVPITDWLQFSLEQEHPDMIFIHNPYDQYNLVTSVHPLFYASKIKDYTDKLVYIPYFVHPNNHVEEHYCLLPGVVHADVVVLQSESVRRQYLQYFEAALPELFQLKGKKAIEDKFQALGSPKFDGGSSSLAEIPEEWKAMIGDGKKVIFFNTHISGLMKEKSDMFLKKLEWVFETFQKRQDVVLLWRPHPLAVDTARSMNEEAVEPYLKLVKKYQELKIGIYDDTPDLHRSIQLSDAYYGTWSSIVELFKQQGKPIMIMDYEVLDDGCEV